MAERLNAAQHLVLNEVNVKELELISDTTGVITKRIKPNFKTLGPRYGKYMKQIAALTAAFTQERIAEIERSDESVIEIGGERIVVTPADFEITSEDMPGWLSPRRANSPWPSTSRSPTTCAPKVWHAS